MDESSFRHCYGNLFESVILKVIWSQLYSFSKIARYIDNSVLKDTLKLKILRKWIKIRATSFIKTWVNIKWKSTKVPWKLSLQKNTTPHFKEHCTKVDDISLIVICFFCSLLQFIYILIFWLLIFEYLIFEFEFHPVALRLF